MNARRASARTVAMGAAGLLLVGAAALPGIDGYPLFVVNLMLLYMLLALGLNVVQGFAGLLDLGFVGFYGIGAYAAALLTLHFRAATGLGAALADFWFLLPVAAVAGAVAGLARGAPTLRLAGDYFAIVTFGFSEIIFLVLTNEAWLTRGPRGLPGIPAPEIGGYVFQGQRPFYLLLLVLVVITVVVMRRMRDSRFGRALAAIRQDEGAARAIGVPVWAVKLQALAVSAAVGALGGAVFARWQTFISPGNFKLWESLLILAMVVFGGMGSISGTLLGAAILVLLSEGLRAVLPPGLVDARYLIFGLLLVLVMRFRPAGLVPARTRVDHLAVGPHPASEVAGATGDRR